MFQDFLFSIRICIFAANFTYMSKTYHRNKKLEFHKILESYEEEHCQKDLPEVSQWTSLTGWSWDRGMNKCCKMHGQAKHNHSLKREYKKFNCDTMSSWTNPVGERHEQSDRCHRVKHDATHRRRHKMKMETQRMVNSSLTETE